MMKAEQKKLDEILLEVEEASENTSLESPARGLSVQSFGFSSLISDFNEMEVYLKDLEKTNRKIETKVKREIFSKNSVHGTYLALRDFLSFKFRGKIITIEDSFEHLLYTLNMTIYNYGSMVDRCKSEIGKLDNYFMELHDSSIKKYRQIEETKGFLERISHANSQVVELAPHEDNYEANKKFKLAIRQLARKDFRNSSELILMERDMKIAEISEDSIDKMVRFMDNFYYINKQSLNEALHYKEIVRNVLGPYIQFVRTSEAYEKMNEGMEHLDSSANKLFELFNKGAKTIAEARKNKAIEKLFARSDSTLQALNMGKGYLPD